MIAAKPRIWLVFLSELSFEYESRFQYFITFHYPYYKDFQKLETENTICYIFGSFTVGLSANVNHR